MDRIIVIPAMGDNYIYLYRCGQGRCFVVDPGEARSTLRAMERYHLTPTHILATHHHVDHIGGVEQITTQYACTVIGPDPERIPDLSQPVRDGDTLELGDARIQVIATPGHTRTGVCYHVLPDSDFPGAVFTGDTLFVAGCGRIFEADAEEMYRSLHRLRDLPDETLVYPGHDYTEENYRFALEIDPDNVEVTKALEDFTRSGSPTRHIPSTIAKEKKTNLFLMADSPQTFAHLRKQKDRF